MREAAFIKGDPVPAPKINIVWESWLTWNDSTVPKLAQAAYDERERACPGECIKGRRASRRGADTDICPDCGGTGRTNDGTFDPACLAILADALEEAGCDNEDLLRHLRGEERHFPADYTEHYKRDFGWRPLSGPHVRGCWVLDLLLNKT
jgi:hypothetical protein